MLESIIRGENMTRKSSRERSQSTKLFVGAAAIIMAATATLSTAAPASASLSECGSGRTCVWSGANYATDWGTIGGFIGFEWCVDKFANHTNINNKTTSVYNNGRTETAYLYDGANKSGSRVVILRGTRKANLSTIGFNDRASSGYFTSGLSLVGSARCW